MYCTNSYTKVTSSSLDGLGREDYLCYHKKTLVITATSSSMAKTIFVSVLHLEAKLPIPGSSNSLWKYNQFCQGQLTSPP